MDPKHKGEVKMPARAEGAHVSPRVIHALVLSLDRFLKDEAQVRREYPWADRFVMGMPLAPWQRPFVWSEEQSAKFITSAWVGIHLGTYVITSEDRLKSQPEVEYEFLAGCVLEGQQRLRALELYFTDQLTVPDRDGSPALWSQVNKVDKLRFKGTVFSRGEVNETDEAKLREFYDLMNFGGVAHLDSERASRQ